MDKESALVVIEGESVSLGVIQARGPTDVIQRASDVATTLAALIESRKLYTLISGRKYVRVEGWSTLGAMLGILPREVRVSRVDGENPGYEAYVELLRASDGAVIGGASAICLRSERNWKTRDEFAIRSMSITRATGKAYRLALSWIIALAGYEPTPAEEMDGIIEPGGKQQNPQRKANPTRQPAQPKTENGNGEDKRTWPPQVVKAVIAAGAENSYAACGALNHSTLAVTDELDVCVEWYKKYRAARDGGKAVEAAATEADAWLNSAMQSTTEQGQGELPL